MTRRRVGLACLLAAATGASVTAAPSATGQVVRVEHYDPQATPARGPTNAMVTVELYFAPSVGNTSRLPAYRQLEALQQKHPTRMRLIYRVVQRGAQPPGPQLPTLALEAYAQGKFFEFVSVIHAERQTLTREKMIELARKVGVDPQRADRAISDDRYREVIDDNTRRLERLRGSTSPMVFFNGKAPRQSISSMSDGDYELAFQDAYDRARELLDKGIPQRDLMQAFDADVLYNAPPVIVSSGPTDDDLEGDLNDQALATPPLALAGWPMLGKPDAQAPVPIVILCRPNDANCNSTMRIVRKVHDTYRGEIRIVWAPWFDVAREDAAELTLLGDAALCADQVGSSPDDLDASPGWQWVMETFTQIGRSHGRRMSPDRLIDNVSEKLRIDPGALSACRARLANTTLDWIAAARRSGVTAAPALVIGGRIYPGLSDERVIQQLVEAELAPGVLGRCSTTGC